MKRIILSAALAITAATCLQARTLKAVTSSICADDSRITYVGRTLSEDGRVSFDWSGVSANVKFEGTGLKVRWSDSKGNDYVNVWIDKKPCPQADFVLRIEGEQEVVLAQGLRKGVHEVTIQKRTEGEQGTITLAEFICDGAFLQADPRRERQIECIGDSYTCGYGTENSIRTDPFRPETENCNLTYAAIAGRYFDADVTFVSHSGQGIVRNWGGGDKAHDMVRRYLHTFDMNDEIVWDAKSCGIVPDIVTIYLGTNDFSCDEQPSLRAWKENYRTLLLQIRANYGEAVPILCIASKADPEMDRYVEEAAVGSGVPNVWWTAIQEAGHNSDSDLGASWHPNHAGHRKVASCVIPYIATLTGWEMPLKAYE